MIDLPSNLPTFYTPEDAAQQIPFSFQITVCLPSRSEEMRDRYRWPESADIAAAGQAWRSFWEEVSQKILAQASPDQRREKFDWTQTREPEAMMSFDPGSLLPELFHPQSLLQIERPTHAAPPALPDVSFLFHLLASDSGAHLPAPDLFCIASTGTFVFDLPIFELGIAECVASRGSVNGHGKGWLKTIKDELIVGLITTAITTAITAGGLPPWGPLPGGIDNLHARWEMQKELDTLGGPCRVEGHVIFHLPSLSERIAKGLYVGPDRERRKASICLEQVALTLLKYYHGPIDGIDGPLTRNATSEINFDWYTQGGGRDEYEKTLVRALTGESPPRKRGGR